MPEPVIGLEVHVELLTKTKMFCSCANTFGEEPNSSVCPVCLGMPGTLPVINKKAVDFALKTALALEGKILSESKFDRKNYFYPDMPKNFQISQYDLPLSSGGRIPLNEGNDNVRYITLKRVHLEEDTGKSIHAGTIDESLYTLEDYNRAGVPLLEIVSEPDIKSPEEAYLYLVRLKAILNYLGVSNCKMEEGSLRCDANVSLRGGDRVEVKNMNSFRAVEKALTFEIKRQTELLEKGEKAVMETRGWDENKNITITLRSKEEAHDYRYFPEPDLPPLKIDQTWIKELKSELPELPLAKINRFIDSYGLSSYEANLLTATPFQADFFEETVKDYPKPKIVSNWLSGDIARVLNDKKQELEQTELTPSHLVEMLTLIDSGVISGKIAKTVVEEIILGKKPSDVVKELGLTQISDDTELASIIEKVLVDNPSSLDDYLKGKTKAFKFLVGQVMKETKGRANPAKVNQLIQDKLTALG